jgi:hypothetical protein
MQAGRGIPDVEKWDTHETVLQGQGACENPFTEVDLSARFVHRESGKAITVDGFYDGGATWRIRFMPSETGTWSYATTSNDAVLDGRGGELNCVSPTAPYLHGPLYAKGVHFQHADGTRRYLISTRVSCHFSTPEVWEALTTYLNEHRIHRVLFIMGGVRGMIGDLYGPDLDYDRYNLEKFRKIDAFIDTLRRADILASPYFYYFNDLQQCPMTLEQDKAFIRYGMARFGAYCNVMPCLSNQVEGKHNPRQGNASTQYDPRNHAWGNEVGAYLKSKAVFGVPVTVHNPLENQLATNPSFYTYLKGWQFPWADFMLRQAQVGGLGAVDGWPDDTPEIVHAGGVEGAGGVWFESKYNPRAYASHNALMIHLRQFGIPVINEEPGYEMLCGVGTFRRLSPRNFNTQTSETLLKTFWTAALAGAYCMWGSLETYTLDDPMPGMANSVTPQYLRVLHDFMAALPYWEMVPDNEVVDPWPVEIEGKPQRTNFCLSKAPETYLFLCLYGRGIEVTLPEGQHYRVTRLNPRWGYEVDLDTIAGGTQEIPLPWGEWVVLCQRER